MLKSATMYNLVIVVLFCSLVSFQLVNTELHPLSDEFIDLINSAQSSWRAGRNFAKDTPLEYLTRLLGVLKSNDTIKLDVVTHPPELLENLPEEFDSRTKWPNCPSLNHIRDQGSCGSCWAFGAVEAMTDRYCIFSNGTKQFYFSAGDLVSCCKSCGNGCYGGDPILAWKYWETNGIVSGGDFNSSEGCRPYVFEPCNHHANYSDLPPCRYYDPTPECKTSCVDGYKNSYHNDNHFGKAYTIPNDEEQIKAELYLNGPVEADFIVYEDFANYKSGVYIHTKGKGISGHAVKILGWGVEDNKKYWLIANSWNAYWGEKGYFKMLRGENHCGIEGGIVAGKPKIAD